MPAPPRNIESKAPHSPEPSNRTHLNPLGQPNLIQLSCSCLVVLKGTTWFLLWRVRRCTRGDQIKPECVGLFKSVYLILSKWREWVRSLSDIFMVGRSLDTLRYLHFSIHCSVILSTWHIVTVTFKHTLGHFVNVFFFLKRRIIFWRFTCLMEKKSKGKIMERKRNRRNLNWKKKSFTTVSQLCLRGSIWCCGQNVKQRRIEPSLSFSHRVFNFFYLSKQLHVKMFNHSNYFFLF